MKEGEGLKICHIVSGDVWAGAEVSAFSLITQLFFEPTVEIEVIVFNSGLLVEKLAERNIPFIVVEENKYSMPRMIWELIKCFRSFCPNIVHTHGLKENLLGGLAAKVSGAQAVFRTHHGRGFIGKSTFKTWMEIQIDKRLTSGSVAVSADLQQFIQANGIIKARSCVIHNGVDLSLVRATRKPDEIRRELNIDDGTKIIGIVGRLVPVKGHKYFIASAKKLLKIRDDLIFLIVGDGPLRTQIELDIRGGDELYICD